MQRIHFKNLIFRGSVCFWKLRSHLFLLCSNVLSSLIGLLAHLSGSYNRLLNLAHSDWNLGNMNELPNQTLLFTYSFVLTRVRWRECSSEELWDRSALRPISQLFLSIEAHTNNGLPMWCPPTEMSIKSNMFLLGDDSECLLYISLWRGSSSLQRLWWNKLNSPS